MTVDEQLGRLARSAERLQADADALDQMLEQIDVLLQQMALCFEYVHPRPLREQTRYDADGKRIIELSYVAYVPFDGRFRLAVKTTKVAEHRLAAERESPGGVMPLLQAPQSLRYAAVDLLPEVISGLASQVDEVASAMERRCRLASNLLEQLHAIAKGVAPGPIKPSSIEPHRGAAKPSAAMPAGPMPIETRPTEVRPAEIRAAEQQSAGQRRKTQPAVSRGKS